nr:MAG TPA: hypothetical protein [Caudoviricetes sp.]
MHLHKKILLILCICIRKHSSQNYINEVTIYV